MKCFKMIQASLLLVLSLAAGAAFADPLPSFEGMPDGYGENSGVAAPGFRCIECEKRLRGDRKDAPTAFVKGSSTQSPGTNDATEGQH